MEQMKERMRVIEASSMTIFNENVKKEYERAQAEENVEKNKKQIDELLNGR
jgi:hypothetical protein